MRSHQADQVVRYLKVGVKRIFAGVFWTPRYFVRRVAWHTLDHSWELEDRIM